MIHKCEILLISKNKQIRNDISSRFNKLFSVKKINHINPEQIFFVVTKQNS
jgi:hypothetical protein